MHHNAHAQYMSCNSFSQGIGVLPHCRYVYKGHDCTLFEASESTFMRDGIKVYSVPVAYQNGQYIGASEACWRIFGNRLHQEQPHIVRLQLHCEGQHDVYFKEGQAIQGVIERASTTTLLEWFKTNQSDPDARGTVYPDFPQSMCGASHPSAGNGVCPRGRPGLIYRASPP